MHRKLLIIFSLLIFSPFLVRAQIAPSLAVSPHTFDLAVFPGESLTQKIKLANKSGVALPVVTKTTDFTASDEEGGIAFDELSQDISFAARKWIKIENPDFILEPGETEIVNFKIEIPENAEPGGHYATILFEPQLPSFYFEEETPSAIPFPRPLELEEIPVKPQVIPVMGVLFLISVRTLTLEPEVGQKLTVAEFSIPKEERLVSLENVFSKLLGNVAQAAAINITEKSPSKFILRIKNNDVYHVKPSGKISIYNIFGKKVGEAEVSQLTILPGKIRAFPVKFSPEIPEYLKWMPASISNFLVQNFFVGKYQAKIELEAKSPLTAEILKPDIPVILTFFSLPWKFWLGFIFLLCLTLFFIVKYRRRIKLAFMTLVHPDKR